MMERMVVTGGGAVQGEIPIAGAKNACLALMPATLLTDQPITLTNVPRLSDIKTMSALLQSLGSEVAALSDDRVLALSSANISNSCAEYDIVRKMRASILVLGPLLAREGRAVVSLPGGCAIGARPVDLHLDGFARLGAELELRDGYVHASAPNGLTSGIVEFPFISVGATENLLLAATLAKGTVTLKNAAREPEIVDLARLLTAMGAKIEGAGTSEIVVEGVTRLNGATHEVVADRIELGTYMIAPLIAGGEVTCLGGRRVLLESFCTKLEEAGVEIAESERGLTVKSDGARPRPLEVTTEPYPGFPTDLQAQMMAALCLADGVSVLNETIFENRFMHAPELMRMGAKIDVSGGRAVITGVSKLTGAPVMATDLRASISLILGGIVGEGETIVKRIYHLDRGYERVEEKLTGIGVTIRREEDV